MSSVFWLHTPTLLFQILQLTVVCRYRAERRSCSSWWSPSSCWPPDSRRPSPPRPSPPLSSAILGLLAHRQSRTQCNPRSGVERRDAVDAKLMQYRKKSRWSSVTQGRTNHCDSSFLPSAPACCVSSSAARCGPRCGQGHMTHRSEGRTMTLSALLQTKCCHFFIRSSPSVPWFLRGSSCFLTLSWNWSKYKHNTALSGSGQRSAT